MELSPLINLEELWPVAAVAHYQGDDDEVIQGAVVQEATGDQRLLHRPDQRGMAHNLLHTGEQFKVRKVK